MSWERVLSGTGLYNIYTFLRDTQRGVEPAWLTEELRQGDRPAAIGGAALAGTCDLCVQALDLCVALYGAEAGNLALKVMATGGVFVGGGIAPRIIAKLKEADFYPGVLRQRPLATHPGSDPYPRHHERQGSVVRCGPLCGLTSCDVLKKAIRDWHYRLHLSLAKWV